MAQLLRLPATVCCRQIAAGAASQRPLISPFNQAAHARPLCNSHAAIAQQLYHMLPEPGPWQAISLHTRPVSIPLRDAPARCYHRCKQGTEGNGAPTSPRRPLQADRQPIITTMCYTCSWLRTIPAHLPHRVPPNAAMDTTCTGSRATAYNNTPLRSHTRRKQTHMRAAAAHLHTALSAARRRAMYSQPRQMQHREPRQMQRT